jgi:hypothetical protein
MGNSSKVSACVAFGAVEPKPATLTRSNSYSLHQPLCYVPNIAVLDTSTLLLLLLLLPTLTDDKPWQSQDQLTGIAICTQSCFKCRTCCCLLQQCKMASPSCRRWQLRCSIQR